MNVLVADKIGDSGIDLLRQHFDVELGVGWTREQLTERIGEYEGVLIRSASKLDAVVINRAARLRARTRGGSRYRARGQRQAVGYSSSSSGPFRRARRPRLGGTYFFRGAASGN